MITPKSLRIGVAAVTLTATAFIAWPSDPVQIRFTYTPDAARVVEGSIARFNEAHEGEFHVEGVVQRSGDAMEAIIGAGTGLPHVWMPASSAWAYLVEEDAPGSIPATRPLPGYFWSPEIIGTWPAVEDQVGSFEQLEQLALDDSALDEDLQPFRWAHPKPLASTSGLFTLVSEFNLATDGRLTVERVADEDAVARVQQMEAAVRHYGDISKDMCPFLEDMDGSFVTAFYMQETTLDGCGGAVPVEPSEGTYAADYPCVALQGETWTTVEERDAAQTFCSWLGGDVADNVDLAASHLRAGSPWNEPGILDIPPADVLKQIRASWSEVRKPAQVTIVLEHSYETSGALEDMKSAVDQLLDGLEDVNIRFVTFSEVVDGGDLGPEEHDVAEEQIREQLEGLTSRDSGDVALGDALSYVYSLEDVVDPDTDTINVIVLLASGINGDGGAAIPYDAMRELRQSRSPVPVFAWAYGRGSKEMEKIAHESGGIFEDLAADEDGDATSNVIDIVSSVV